MLISSSRRGEFSRCQAAFGKANAGLSRGIWFYLERCLSTRQVSADSAAPGARDQHSQPARPHAGALWETRASAVVQYAPYEESGEHGRGARNLLENSLNVLGVGPRNPRQVTAHNSAARGSRREFRLTGGHWHHGSSALDQFSCMRPVPGAAQYAIR